MGSHDSKESAVFKRYMESGSKAIDLPVPYSLDAVRSELKTLKVSLEKYYINVPEYHDFMQNNSDLYSKSTYARQGISTLSEKSLEHFLSFQFTDKGDDPLIVVDVASAWSPFPDIISRRFDCQVVCNDLSYREGLAFVRGKGWHFGGYANDLPFADNSVDLMTLHCALEMFEGDSDIGVIAEAGRVLKKNGKLVVVPLYMHEADIVYCDPVAKRITLPVIDPKSTLVFRNNFMGIAFSRMYSPQSFVERLLNPHPGMKVTIMEIMNAAEVHPSVYARWIGVFEKR